MQEYFQGVEYQSYGPKKYATMETNVRIADTPVDHTIYKDSSVPGFATVR